MANEYPSAKKEPPWLPILPPVPRISVSTNSRARLSHRCPILLSSSTPLPLPKAVVPSTPSALPSKSRKNSEETSSIVTPPVPSAASTSPVAGVDVSWPGSSSPVLERFDSPAPAAALNPDAVCKPVNSCSLGNNNSSGNCSSLWTDSDFVRPNPEECIPAYGSNSAISCSIFKNLSAPALQQCSREDDHKVAKEGAAGLTVHSVGGVDGGKEPDSGKSNENGGTCNDMEFTTAGTTSSAMGLNTLEEVDDSRSADIRVKQENCSGATREAEISYLGKDEKLVVDDIEVEVGQLLGDGVNEAKDADFGEPGEDGCTSSDMEFTVAWTTLSARCFDTLGEVDEGNGADVRDKQESCEMSCLVENENLVTDGVEGEEGHLRGDGVNAAKDPDCGKPGKIDCTTSDMEFTVAETTSSTRCRNLPEEAEQARGACSSQNLESCPDNGHEAKRPDSVKNEEFGLDEGELEEGQLPGEWSGGEESQEDSESDQTLEGSATVSSVVRGVSISPDPVNVADHIYYPFQVEEIPSKQRIRGNSEANKGMKKKKHKKGEGSKKRSREKSKEKYNEVRKKRRVEGKWVDGASNPSGLRNSKDCSNGTGKLKKAPEILPQTIPKKPAVDEGPEDGEILLESTKTNNGILSSLIEDEVGLWTTDNVDDQFVTEMEQDGTVKKKRGPETAERKLKRKIAKRKKRAQKERELGIRRPPRTSQNRPVKVLCTHYMKGRCAKGDQCTYSHDAVPLTKLEPCKFLMSHTCLKGDDCPYSHDLRAFPCKFFHTRGLCYDGANCKFSHGAISEEALEKLKQRVEKEKKERINSISAFDIPTPSFSTPLPPELDPDPLGWGTSTTYSNHEEPIQRTNPTILDHSYGDFDPENQAGTSPALDMMSGQSIHVSHQSIDTNDTKFAADSRPQQIVEKAKEGKYMQTNNTEAMESGKSMHLGGLTREAESPGPMGLQSSGAPYISTMPRTLKTPVCSSPSNGKINAREVLEVSRMEGKMDDAQQSPLQEPSTNSNESCTQGVLSVVHSSMVSPLAGKLGVPLLRGRQLGSLVVEKNGKSPLPAESKRQHTVESLLGEALRQ